MIMTENLQDLFFNKNHILLRLTRDGILIDTTILILYLVGVFDKRNKTNNLKRVNMDIYDFDSFIRFKERLKIKNIYVTPNVLTETYNQIENKIGSWFFESNLIEIKEIINNLEELYKTKEEIISLESFGRFDFTDLSLYLTTKDNINTFITADSNLSLHCKTCEGMVNKLIIELHELNLLRTLST